MDAFRVKSTDERQYENGDTPQRIYKQQNLQDDKEIELANKMIMKIVDLNDDCLVNIFEYLNVQNLFNVAVANAFMRPAAVAAYKSKFFRKKVYLSYYSSYKVRVHEWETSISVAGLKTCLQYLRCFGLSIKNLEISYNGSKIKWDEHVNHYISTYCADSLNKIEFIQMPNETIDHFIRPFINVHSIDISWYEFGEKSPKFIKLFPNLRHLIVPIRSNDYFDNLLIPHLEHLHIIVYEYAKQNATNLLHSNQQLQSLELNLCFYLGWIDGFNTLLDMIKDHSLITKFHVRFPHGKFLKVNPVNPLEIKRIVNEHSSLVDLNLTNLQFTIDNAIALIDQLKLLKMFEFKIIGSSNYEQMKSKLNQNEWMITELYYTNSNQVRLNRLN